MNLLPKISYKDGWVFSAKADMACFTLPFLAAFYFDGSNYFNQSWFGFFLTKVFFAGHIFTTHFPLTQTIEKSPQKWRFFILPALYICTYLALCLIDFRYFQNFLCLTILMHIFFQHISWGKISVGRSPYALHYLKVLIFTPILLWMLNQLPSGPHYLYNFSLTENLPKLNWTYECWVLSALFILGSVLSSISKVDGRHTLMLGRLHFFMTTTLWLVYGLFYAHSVSFFLYYLNIAHGLSYMIYISRSWPNHHHLPRWESHHPIYKVAMVSLIGGGIWMAILWNAHKYLAPQYLILPWLPLIIHFAFDSYLWSRTRLQAIRL